MKNFFSSLEFRLIAIIVFILVIIPVLGEFLNRYGHLLGLASSW